MLEAIEAEERRLEMVEERCKWFPQIFQRRPNYFPVSSTFSLALHRYISSLVSKTTKRPMFRHTQFFQDTESLSPQPLGYCCQDIPESRRQNAAW